MDDNLSDPVFIHYFRGDKEDVDVFQEILEEDNDFEDVDGFPIDIYEYDHRRVVFMGRNHVRLVQHEGGSSIDKWYNVDTHLEQEKPSTVFEYGDSPYWLTL